MKDIFLPGNPYLPPTKKVEKRDIILPDDSSSALEVLPEVESVPGQFNLDEAVKNFIDSIRTELPTNRSVIVERLVSYREKFRLSTQTKYAQAMAEHLDSVAKIIQSANLVNDQRTRFSHSQQLLQKQYNVEIEKLETELRKTKRQRELDEAEFAAKIAEAKKKQRRSEKS